jgi:putative tryptophan/tyrosine transport system substrate-binding protein
MQFCQLKRREFIMLLGGAAVWPLAAHSQQADQTRRIGMLVGFDDPDIQAFKHELERLGWSEGRNIHIDYHYAPAGTDVQRIAKELVALQPAAIFAQSRPATAALQRETKTIPIVFNFVIDPIGAGFVASFPRPGGNLTGFVVYEAPVVGKWMAMLKEIAPQTARVVLLGNPKTAPYFDYLLQAAKAAAPSLGVEPVPSRIENDASDIERAITAIGSMSNNGLLVLPDSTTSVNVDVIIGLAARYRLPAVYTNKFMVAKGGLMSYGVLAIEQYRLAASYVDRILRGVKPGDLPVQTPTKYETVVNLKTANALGLTMPAGLLVAADEVIE